MPAKGHHMNLKTSVECFSCAPTVAVAPDKFTVRRQLPETDSGCRSPLGSTQLLTRPSTRPSTKDSGRGPCWSVPSVSQDKTFDENSSKAFDKAFHVAFNSVSPRPGGSPGSDDGQYLLKLLIEVLKMAPMVACAPPQPLELPLPVG